METKKHDLEQSKLELAAMLRQHNVDGMASAYHELNLEH